MAELVILKDLRIRPVCPLGYSKGELDTAKFPGKEDTPLRIERLALVKQNGITSEMFICINCIVPSVWSSRTPVFMLDAEVDVGFTYQVDKDVWDDERPGCLKFDYAL
ncbi:hypothetical protein VSDG_08936 [Cytospora chrysosperma]|uniref:Uncharacterized protein n=1 Tax=Cytospora chrysosperma TaxID=252740 RepID=A0A423VD60_CYTCH|nr:hypothetical protein VSDG_08936 [Valsa sordida]